MPIGLVAGCSGGKHELRARATQLYNEIKVGDKTNWRIFYFNKDGIAEEYTTSKFNNPGVIIEVQTHCLILCHGEYCNRGNDLYQSTRLSRWDTGAASGVFSTSTYTDWLRNVGVGVSTVIIAACHAGDVVLNKRSPIKEIVAIRPGIQADGPNSALMALGGVNVNWSPAAPRNWTRFIN